MEPDHQDSAAGLFQPPAPDQRLDGGVALPVSIHASGAANSVMGCSGDNPTASTGNTGMSASSADLQEGRSLDSRAAADPYERALQLLQLFAWMRASHIRPATIETLLALALGANTPSEIRQRTAHPAGTVADRAIAGLSHNGAWVALKTLLGQGQGRRNGKNLVPRCEPLAGRKIDPHAKRGDCFRYGVTPEGQNLLERLVGVKLS